MLLRESWFVYGKPLLGRKRIACIFGVPPHCRRDPKGPKNAVFASFPVAEGDPGRIHFKTWFFETDIVACPVSLDYFYERAQTAASV